MARLARELFDVKHRRLMFPIAGLVIGLLAMPVASGAQPSVKVLRVGILAQGSPPASNPLVPALHDFGWVKVAEFREIEAAASMIGIGIQSLEARAPAEIEPALKGLRTDRRTGVLAMQDGQIWVADSERSVAIEPAVLRSPPAPG